MLTADRNQPLYDPVHPRHRTTTVYPVAPSPVLQGNIRRPSPAYWVETEMLRSCVWTAFDMQIWDTPQLTRAMVQQALDTHTYQSTPNDCYRQEKHATWDAERVAYLIRSYDPTPIMVDANNTGFVHIVDGWHRYSVAIFLGRPFLKVEPMGWLDMFFEVFPTARRCSPLDPLTGPIDPLPLLYGSV